MLDRRLRIALRNTEKTPTEIARATGIPQQVLQRFLNGRQHHLRTDTLEKLLPAIGLQVIDSADVAKSSARESSVQSKVRELAISCFDVEAFVSNYAAFDVSLETRNKLMRQLKAIRNQVDALECLAGTSRELGRRDY